MAETKNIVRIQANDRIHLSAIRAGDAAAYVEHLNNLDVYNSTLSIPYPYTEQDAETFIAIAAETTAKHGHPTGLAIRDEHEKLIGGFGFEGLAYGHRAEIGYWLAKPNWGRGIMTDVVRAACAYAIDQWQLVRITAHVFDRNERSARVLEKNNFAFEGLLRNHHRKEGEFIDSRLYALLP